MRWEEDNRGMLEGERGFFPVCSECKNKILFHQSSGLMLKFKFCPMCGHEIDWSKL